MDEILNRRKSLEQQLEELKRKELEIIAKRKAAEQQLAERQRKSRTRAFVCMGALIDKMMKNDSDLKNRLIAEAQKENIYNREGMGRYWNDFMPPEGELQLAKQAKREKAAAKAAMKTTAQPVSNDAAGTTPATQQG